MSVLSAGPPAPSCEKPARVPLVRRVRYCGTCGKKAPVLRWPFTGYGCPKCGHKTHLPGPMATVEVCSVCVQAHLAGERICPNCGAPADARSAADEWEPPAQPGSVFNPAERVLEADVAAVLNVIAAPPNRRSRPQEGDLAGDYHEWFDGGAIRHVTGSTIYEFHNGIRARVDVLPRLSITIGWTNGRVVSIEQAPYQ